jgi:hypothetical protein
VHGRQPLHGQEDRHGLRHLAGGRLRLHGGPRVPQAHRWVGGQHTHTHELACCRWSWCVWAGLS